jgi:hypothetical protein
MLANIWLYPIDKRLANLFSYSSNPQKLFSVFSAVINKFVYRTLSSTEINHV